MACTVNDLDACTCHQPWGSILPGPPCPVHTPPTTWWTYSPVYPTISTTTTVELGPQPAARTGRRTNRPGLWWAIHNLIAHPVSEVCFWLHIPRFGNWLHDATVPEHDTGTGRG